MKERWITLVFIAVTCSLSPAVNAQQPVPSNPAPAGAANDAINPGTIIQVEVTGDIDAKKAHASDVFRTRLWDDVRSGDKIVLPQKTMLVGHVVEAQPRTKDNPESKLTITFDKAVLKNGTELPLHGVVERVQLSSLAAAAATDSNNPGYNQDLNPGSTTNVAMPNAAPTDQKTVTLGPTNIRDSSIIPKADPTGTLTVLTTTAKGDVKLKHYATLDVRVTHSGE